MNIPILKTRSRLREVKRLVLSSGFEPTYLLALSLLEESILDCSQGRHSIRNMSLYRKKISTGYSFASQLWYAAGRAKQGCGRGRRQDLCSRRVQLWRAERSVRWSGRAARSNQEEGPGTLGCRGLGRLRGDSCSGVGVCSQGFQRPWLLDKNRREPGGTSQIWTSGHTAPTPVISCSNAVWPTPWLPDLGSPRCSAELVREDGGQRPLS